MLASLLAPESSQYAVRTALEIYTAYRNQSATPVLQDMFEDPLGLSEGLTSEFSFLSCVHCSVFLTARDHVSAK